MNILLEDIFRTKKYKRINGEEIVITSETSREQCIFLRNIIEIEKLYKTIEIGFAYGMSALAITEVVAKYNSKHTIIDKFEISDWQSVGLELIEKAGLTNNIIYYEEFCYEILPKLLQEKQTYNFAYIDSTKQFDWLLVDFFYLDKILEVGGIIVFDDCDFPGIRKLMRFISQFPNYKVYNTFPKNSKHKPKKNIFFTYIKYFFPNIKKYLKSEIIIKDQTLGIDDRVVCFRKIKEDNRNWDWHCEF